MPNLFLNSNFLDEKGSYFVGKTKNLRKIEELLIACENKFPLTGINLEKFENVKPEIEKLFADEFNCEKFYLASSGVASAVMLQMSPKHLDLTRFAKIYFMANAYTIPTAESLAMLRTGNFAPKRIFTRDSSGRYKFISKNKAPCVFVHILPAMIANCNARQFIATVLHEVGHNFYAHGLISSFFAFSSIFVRSILSQALGVANKFLDDITPNFVKSILNYVQNFGSKILKFVVEISIFEKSINFVKLFKDNLLAPFANPYSFVNYAVGFLSGGYSNEVFADQFCAAYGYGPELAEGMLQFFNTIQPTKEIKKSSSFSENIVDNGLDILNTLIALPFTVFNQLSSLYDVHPGATSRLFYCKNFIEKEIEKEKDPRIKKEMEECLKKFEIVIDRNKFAFLLNSLKIPADVIKHGIDKILGHNDFNDVVKPINNSGNIFL